MLISDWSSDVCSSYLLGGAEARRQERRAAQHPSRLMRDQPQFDQTERQPPKGFGKGKGGPALFLGSVPICRVIAARGFEQRQELIRLHARFKDEQGLGRDRMLSFVVQVGHCSI